MKRHRRRELKTGVGPAGFFPSRVLYPPHSRPSGRKKTDLSGPVVRLRHAVLSSIGIMRAS